VTKGRIRAYD
jgi:hypothetical protein